MTLEGYKTSKTVRRMSYDAVLRVPKNNNNHHDQRTHHSSLLNSDMIIAQLYEDVSNGSVQRAILIAKEDAGSASRYLGIHVSYL